MQRWRLWGWRAGDHRPRLAAAVRLSPPPPPLPRKRRRRPLPPWRTVRVGLQAHAQGERKRANASADLPQVLSARPPRPSQPAPCCPSIRLAARPRSPLSSYPRPGWRPSVSPPLTASTDPQREPLSHPPASGPRAVGSTARPKPDSPLPAHHASPPRFAAPPATSFTFAAPATGAGGAFSSPMQLDSPGGGMPPSRPRCPRSAPCRLTRLRRFWVWRRRRGSNPGGTADAG